MSRKHVLDYRFPFILTRKWSLISGRWSRATLRKELTQFQKPNSFSVWEAQRQRHKDNLLDWEFWSYRIFFYRPLTLVVSQVETGTSSCRLSVSFQLCGYVLMSALGSWINCICCQGNCLCQRPHPFLPPQHHPSPQTPFSTETRDTFDNLQDCRRRRWGSAERLPNVFWSTRVLLNEHVRKKRNGNGMETVCYHIGLKCFSASIKSTIILFTLTWIQY